MAVTTHESKWRLLIAGARERIGSAVAFEHEPPAPCDRCECGR